MHPSKLTIGYHLGVIEKNYKTEGKPILSLFVGVVHLAVVSVTPLLVVV